MPRGWIGVDLDGTLAEYHPEQGIGKIGYPIYPMVERINKWLDEGYEVRIFTARVAACGQSNDDGVHDSASFAAEQVELIEDWCRKHLGYTLRVTATKDFLMAELWDDRCVRVITNTGIAIEVK
jgi:hypothetical protein